MNVNNPWPQTYQAGIVRQAFDAGNYVTEGTGVDFADDINLAMGKVEADGFDVNRVRPAKVKAHLRGLRSTTRSRSSRTSPRARRTTLYGEPIAYVANGPWVNNYELIAGDRSMAILGVRRTSRSRSSPRASSRTTPANVVTEPDAAGRGRDARRRPLRLRGRVNPINLDNATDATRFPFAVVVNAGS
jgi:hypothetical protein